MTTIQDVWDQIISCLEDSQPDLRSCALVSRSWTARAQYHLFRRVLIPGPDFLNLETVHNPCGRLGQILSGSPHLIPFIRILDVPFTTEVLAQVCAMGLTHLEFIAFALGHSNTTDSTPAPIFDYAQHLIALPSIQKLGFSAARVQPGYNLTGMTRIFCDLSLRLEHLRFSGFYCGIPETPSARLRRPRIKVLQLDSSSLGEYFIHPHCPFDLTQLVDFTLSHEMSRAMAKSLELGRLTLKRLACLPGKYAPRAVLSSDFDFGADALVNQRVELSRFPSLANLVVLGPQAKLAAIAHSISQSNLDTQNCIENITLILFFDGRDWYEEDGRIGKLDALLSEMPALIKVGITFQMPLNVAGDGTQRLRSAFPKLDARGVLELTAA
ncbi:hypothetical protein C8F04DRAFT_182614 [Mycena alexandri]|uniref:F-box domain-containing protein n=1 Tax=Mycena alexandri TaxID=1745969 RepID=A0AAD6WQH8_9AGAR|nr:hypothetical protein C8F04DRAFT_182614 [Mycena alexandri]